jgi:parallel beta-helix repeat protein
MGMVPGVNTGATPRNNALALLAIINLAQASNDQSANKYYGATIIFPGHHGVPSQGGTGEDMSGVYFISGPGDGTPTIPITSNWPIKFMGTGSAKLFNLIDPDNPDGFMMGDFFSIQTSGVYDSDGHKLGENLGGMTFENLTLQFDKNTTQTGIAGIHTAFDTAYGGNGGAQNVRINGCVFTDCPIGVWFEEALQCSMFQCTVNLTNLGGTGLKIGGPSSETASDVFAKDIFITDCIFEVIKTAPRGNVALDLISAEHLRLNGVRFDNFDQGIQIRPGYDGGTSPVNVVRCFFTDVTVFVGQTSVSGVAGTALTIQPQNTNVQIGQLTFVGCTFEPGDSPDITSSGPGIIIDAKGAFIDTVRFVSCYSARWTGPGMSIGVPDGTGTLQNIEVLGGMYSGNNLGSGPSYGIAVYAPASAVRIVGTSCVGKYQYITQGTSAESNQQEVGIYVDSGASNIVINGCDLRENADYGIVVNAASDVLISGCDLSSNAVGSSGAGVQVNAGATNVVIDSCDVTNNGTNGIQVVATSGAVTGVYIRNCNASGYSSYGVAIYVDATGTNAATVEITNCAGYNDRGVTLTSTPPTSTVTFYPYTFGYWGPIEFYTIAEALGSSISAIVIDGTNVNLKSGSFLLVPGEHAAITWTAGIANIAFIAIGK